MGSVVNPLNIKKNHVLHLILSAAEVSIHLRLQAVSGLSFLSTSTGFRVALTETKNL